MYRRSEFFRLTTRPGYDFELAVESMEVNELLEDRADMVRRTGEDELTFSSISSASDC